MWLNTYRVGKWWPFAAEQTRGAGLLKHVLLRVDEAQRTHLQPNRTGYMLDGTGSALIHHQHMDWRSRQRGEGTCMKKMTRTSHTPKTVKSEKCK